MNVIEYAERLEQIISDLHHELEMARYSVEDTGAASDIARSADQLWNEFCETKSRYYCPIEDMAEAELPPGVTQEQAQTNYEQALANLATVH